MKLNHKQKVKMARKMRTRKEESTYITVNLKDGPVILRKNKTPLFQSRQWEDRRQAKTEKIASIRIESDMRRQAVNL